MQAREALDRRVLTSRLRAGMSRLRAPQHLRKRPIQPQKSHKNCQQATFTPRHLLAILAHVLWRQEPVCPGLQVHFLRVHFVQGIPMLHRFLPFLTLLVLPVQVHAAENPIDSALRAPAFSLKPEQLLALKAAKAPAGNDAELLVDDQTFRFDAQGRVTVEQHFIYRVLSERGVKNWSGVGRTYHPWHEEKPQIEARVVTPDAQVHQLDAATLVDGAAAGGSAEQYSDARKLQGPLPAVREGAVVEVTMKVAEHKPFFETGRVERYTFGSETFCAVMRVTVEAPDSLPLIWQVRGSKEKATIKKADGKQVLSMSQHDLLPLEEYPAATDPTQPVFVNLEFSTAKNWHDLAQTYAKAVDARVGEFDAKPVAAKITEGATTDTAKIQKIVAWIHQHVRYTGLELGVQSILPVAPGETLTRRYGDCKDKATLAVALLRAAGLNANVALLSTGPGLDLTQDVPGFGLFNHAIVVVEGAKPQDRLWIDATASYSVPGQLPYVDQGRQALIASPQTTTLTRTPETTAAASTTQEKLQVTFTELGFAEVNEETSGTGPIDAELRGLFDQDAAQLKDQMTKYLKERFQAKLRKVEANHPMDLGKPFLLRLEATDAEVFETTDTGGQVTVDGNRLYARLPRTLYATPDSKKDKSKAEEAHDPRFRMPTDLPVHVAEAHTQRVRYEMSLPEGFHFQLMPEEKTLSGDGISVSRTASQPDPRHAVVEYTLSTEAHVIPVARLEKVREMLDDFQSQSAISVRFGHDAKDLLDRGDVSGALKLHRQLVAHFPKSVATRSRYAREVLGLGFGMSARAEAEKLAKEFPNDALAQWTAGFAFVHDELGRDSYPDADFVQAEKYMRLAVNKDPKDEFYLRALAKLLDFRLRQSVVRDKAKAEEVISFMEKLRKDFGQKRLDLELLAAYLWEAKNREAIKLAEDMKPDDDRNGILVAAVAGLHGVQAARRKAETLVHGQTMGLLDAAKQNLATIGNYPLAAEIAHLPEFTTVAAASVRGVNAALGKEKCLKAMAPEARLVYDFMRQNMVTVGAFDGNYPVLKEKPYKDVADAFSLAKNLNEWVNAFSKNSPRSLSTLRYGADILPCLFRWDVVEKEGAIRVRLLEETANANDASDSFYLRKGKNGLLLIGASVEGRVVPFALAIRQALAEKKLAEARVWLTWLKPMFGPTGRHKDTLGYDDAIRALWPTDADKATDGELTILACAMQANGDLETEDLARTDAAAKLYAGDAEKLAAVQFTRARVLFALEKFAEAAEKFAALSKQFPDDEHIAQSVLAALNNAHKGEELRRALDAHDVKWPENKLTATYRNLQDRRDGKYAEVVDRALQRLAEHKATPDELNRAAWDALFVHGDLTKAAKLAEAACEPQSQAPAAILHTLATLHAEMGEYGKAWRELDLSMKKNDSVELNDAWWYTWGRLAEGLELPESAIHSYKRVKKPTKYAEHSMTELVQQRPAKFR